jgi:NhaP-type Na+/H+ or K+/H+ antiporter
LDSNILTGMVVLVTLGCAAQWLAWRLRLPSLLLLLVVGFVAGPVTDLVDPQTLLGPLTFPLVSLGAAVVLFEGGLTTSWQDIRSVAAPVRRLITVGLLLTWALATIAAVHLLGFSLELAALLGAILVVTGPTVIGPLLRHLRPHGQVGPILKLEGILNDPIGAVLAVLVFQFIQAEQVQTAASAVVSGLLKTAIVSTVLGVFAGRSYGSLLRRQWVPEFLQNTTLLPLVLGVYALANSVQHESGLVAVTVMGIQLASQRDLNLQPSLEFTEHARTIVISVLFVLLTARMEMADLKELSPGAFAFAFALIFVVRPASVFISLIGVPLPWRQKLFLAGIAPRGIVAAAVASLFALALAREGVEGAESLLPVTFLVIASCVVIYGLGGRALVRALKLGQSSAQGVLLMGAGTFARELAKALSSLKLRVVLVDTERSNVLEARAMKLEAYHGRLLTEHTLNHLSLDEIGKLVALTPNDDANTLAVAHFRQTFGPGGVYQLHADKDGSAKAYAVGLRGGPFAEGHSYEYLSGRLHRGAVVKVTRLTESFSYSDYLSEYDGGVLVLFVLTDEGKLRVMGKEAPEPRPGDRIVGLVAPREQQPARPDWANAAKLVAG